MALGLIDDLTPQALALIGPVAGADGAWRLGLLLFADAKRRDRNDAMIEAVLSAAKSRGARTIVAELPADAVIGKSLTALRANRFHQEARIADYYRDGVGLLFLRRDL